MAKSPKTYEMKVRPLAVEVNSERTPGKKYEVTLASCKCPDFTYRHGRDEFPFCKHIVAAYADFCPELAAPLKLLADLLK